MPQQHGVEFPAIDLIIEMILFTGYEMCTTQRSVNRRIIGYANWI